MPRHKVVMDNLGCVFIMGGVVPSFATGGREWGEFVSGGSPNHISLRRLQTAVVWRGLVNFVLRWGAVGRR